LSELRTLFFDEYLSELSRDVCGMFMFYGTQRHNLI
jgi:hypothetical protein